MKKTFMILTLLLALAVCLASCAQGDDTTSEISSPLSDIPAGEIPDEVSKSDLGSMDFEFTDRDENGNYDKNNVTDVGEIASEYSITSGGTYIFSGSITDSTITVNAGENEKVQIVLDNAKISNSKGPAIYIGSADKVFITLKEGTENSISDGSGYSVNDEKGEVDAAIFSRADLTVNGSGALTVNGNYKHGIVSKDDLVIVSATLSVDAKKVALNGKDCVKINGASLNVTAGSDGIRSDNDEDASRGFVYIESGKIAITAGNDGIQAETAIKILTAEMNVTAGGGSAGSLGDQSESYKGIKAASDILIYGGEFVIDSLDDAIHSNNTICIEGGRFTLSTCDDGIHADTDLAISSGEITVTKSYEGLESSRIFITGGIFDITASDDGLNAAGGNDGSSGNNPFGGGRPKPGGFGGDMFGGGSGEIVISGGYLLVDASGDGIDSNGSITLSGGTVLVSGPVNNGNGAFDYDGTAKVTGGTLVALGSSGMAQSFSEAEGQGAILTTFSTVSGGTNIAICDSDGKTVASFTPKKNYQCMAVTAKGLQLNGGYTVYVGAEIEDADANGFSEGSGISGGTKITEITLSSLIYGSGGRPGGDHGGGPGGFRPKP